MDIAWTLQRRGTQMNRNIRAHGLTLKVENFSFEMQA